MNLTPNTTTRPLAEIVPDAPTTSDAFLAWTATLGGEYEGQKLELSRGRVTKMMTNVSRRHARVCANIMGLLLTHLDLNQYNVTAADFGVKTPRGIRSPDILVEPYGSDLESRASENPILIEEVLSPSTASVEFLENLPEHIGIAKLNSYLICSQHEPVVWLMTRAGDGGWPGLPEKIQGSDGSVPSRDLG